MIEALEPYSLFITAVVKYETRVICPVPDTVLSSVALGILDLFSESLGSNEH